MWRVLMVVAVLVGGGAGCGRDDGVATYKQAAGQFYDSLLRVQVDLQGGAEAAVVDAHMGDADFAKAKLDGVVGDKPPRRSLIKLTTAHTTLRFARSMLRSPVPGSADEGRSALADAATGLADARRLMDADE